jgi:hypothetical protein
LDIEELQTFVEVADAGGGFPPLRSGSASPSRSSVVGSSGLKQNSASNFLHERPAGLLSQKPGPLSETMQPESAPRSTWPRKRSYPPVTFAAA